MARRSHNLHADDPTSQASLVPRNILGDKALTAKIRELAAEVIGDGMTRAEVLARLLWQKALGWEEKFLDEEGNRKTKMHLPESWAMQYIWERIEGKPNVATPDEGGRVKAADKVRELAKKRLDQMAREAAGVPVKGPPKYVPAGKDGEE